MMIPVESDCKKVERWKVRKTRNRQRMSTVAADLRLSSHSRPCEDSPLKQDSNLCEVQGIIKSMM